MFRVTRYPMISKTESGRVGYRKKYRVAGWVRVPAGHCWEAEERGVGMVGSHIFDNNLFLRLEVGFLMVWWVCGGHWT